MACPPVILLPPSEGKARGGAGPPWAPGAGSFATLDDRRAQVLAALAVAVGGPPAAVAKLLGVKGVALEAAVAADRAATMAPTMSAVERYTGVLYDALDAGSLPPRQRRRLHSQVAIISGLWGVVQPADPIPDYKLKMGAALAPLGRLSTWWRPAITEALTPLVARRVVWDLLPNEHRAAWTPPPAGSGPTAPAAVLSARFLDEHPLRDGERRFTTVSHWNKLLKGALVRHVLTTQLDDPAGLVEFTHPEGYTYDPTLTLEHDGRTDLAFVRPARS